ncbi:MAG: hypothetical protein FWC02_01980 [Firmicutes bacterium]|nr:hypothetical protein [Bacillota bacterium]
MRIVCVRMPRCISPIIKVFLRPDGVRRRHHSHRPPSHHRRPPPHRHCPPHHPHRRPHR